MSPTQVITPTMESSPTYPPGLHLSNTSTPSRLEDRGIELSNLGLTGKQAPINQTPSLRGSISAGDQGSGFTMSINDERLYLAALSWCLFLAGWNDATLGPVSLRFQSRNLSDTLYFFSCF
jgi:hypothetical protein